MALDKSRMSSWNDTAYTRRARYSHPTDSQANMVASNYFNAAWDALPKGTIVDCTAALNSTPVHFSVVVTASSESGGVTVALQTVE